jgi:hypothetical protein
MIINLTEQEFNELFSIIEDREPINKPRLAERLNSTSPFKD